MAERDGDGWVSCKCGSRHWGLNGASGVVLLDPRAQKVLLQLRAEWTHGGRVWGIPGGARDSHESAIDSAMREMYEEMQIAADHVEVIHDNRWTDHEDWHYHTVIATTSGDIAYTINEETELCEWIELDRVADLELHPGFKSTWFHVRGVIDAHIKSLAR